MRLSANVILEDIKLPDYKGRHVFTAKLRLAIFIAFWAIGFFYFESIWKNAPWIPLLISMAFLLTGVCYQNILKQRVIIPSFMFELAADVFSITLIIYATGGAKSDYYTIYLMYCLAAGMFYNYQVAIAAALLSLLFYSAMLIALTLGWLNPLNFVADFYNWATEWPGEEYSRFFLLFMLLPIVVYGVKISGFFSTLKQRALEERHKQLVALNRISSTIRRMMSFHKVIRRVLAGVVEGLGYDVCLLVMPRRSEDMVDFFVPRRNPLIQEIESKISFKLEEMRFSKSIDNSIAEAIRSNRIVFGKNLFDLTRGLSPLWSEELANRVQTEMGFKKFIIMPLVAERRVIGALVGISRSEYVDEARIGVLENFSNQAALAIESAQLFEKLKNKNLELERANRIKNEFLAVMSHELRTPLTAIIGFSELLMEEAMGELNSQQKSSLKEVVRNGEHLLQLINNVLDLAKVEAGKMDLSAEKFNIEDLIQEVKNWITPLVVKKNQQFICEVEPGLPIFYGDVVRIRQILLNLLSNAIKFTSPLGTIKLIVKHLQFEKRAEDPRLAKLPVSEKGYLQIQVEDNGVGIDAKDLNKIFEVFAQADTSMTRHYQGTGLGLALTRQFVEMHQGMVWVESEKNKGSTFFILFPVEPSSKNLEETQ